MQLYKEGWVGGGNGSKAFVLDVGWLRRVVVLGKGERWFLFRCHLKGTLFKPERREEGQPLRPSLTHTLRGVRAHTLAHMKHSELLFLLLL